MIKNRSMTDCIERLGGNAAVAKAVGVVPHAVSQAKANGKFPPKWFVALRDLAEVAGEELPEELFAWAAPSKPRAKDEAAA